MMLFVLFSLLLVPLTGAPRPPPQGPRDSFKIRSHGMRVQEVVARRAAVTQFEAWAALVFPAVSMEMLARSDVPTLSDLLQEYCYQCFEERLPAGHCRHLLVRICDRFGWLRRVLGGPWKVIAAWEREEPSEPRSPIPVHWVQALVLGALSIGWMSMALSLLLGFFGLLRPIELFTLRRRDLLLSADHGLGSFLMVQLLGPKSRWRGRPNEYVRIDEQPVVQAVAKLAARLKPAQPVWSYSPSTFGARLRRLSHRAFGPSITVLPSSLRTGGATYYFQNWAEDLNRVMWRGRWRDARVLSSYIQECGAALVQLKLEGESAARVRALAD